VGREAEETVAPLQAEGARHEGGGVGPLDGGAGGGGARSSGRRGLAAAMLLRRGGQVPGHHARRSAGANDVDVAGAAAPLQGGGCGRAPHVFLPLLDGGAAAEGCKDVRGMLWWDFTNQPNSTPFVHSDANAAMNIRWCALSGAIRPAHRCNGQPACVAGIAHSALTSGGWRTPPLATRSIPGQQRALQRKLAVG
jgi:hypothetical protein